MESMLVINYAYRAFFLYYNHRLLASPGYNHIVDNYRVLLGNIWLIKPIADQKFDNWSQISAGVIICPSRRLYFFT
jgi:hypothetical protein